MKIDKGNVISGVGEDQKQGQRINSITRDLPGKNGQFPFIFSEAPVDDNKGYDIFIKIRCEDR